MSGMWERLFAVVATAAFVAGGLYWGLASNFEVGVMFTAQAAFLLALSIHNRLIRQEREK